MRITLSLDDDIVVTLKQASYRTHTRDMGELGPGLQIDRASLLIESAEGPLAR